MGSLHRVKIRFGSNGPHLPLDGLIDIVPVEFNHSINELKTDQHDLDAAPVQFFAKEYADGLHGVLNDGRRTGHGPDFGDFLFGYFGELLLAVSN